MGARIGTGSRNGRRCAELGVDSGRHLRHVRVIGLDLQLSPNRALLALLRDFDGNHIALTRLNRPLGNLEETLRGIHDLNPGDGEGGFRIGSHQLEITPDRCRARRTKAGRVPSLEDHVAAGNHGDGGLVIDGHLNHRGAHFTVAAHRFDGKGVPDHSRDESGGSIDLNGVGFARFHFADFTDRNLFFLGGSPDDGDVQIRSLGDCELSIVLTAQRTAQVQCGGLNLENLKQLAANIQADRRSFGVIAADRGVFANRFGTQAGGVDTDGDDALPAGENFAGEIPAGAASARFDVGDPQDLRANIAKLVGVLDDGSLQDGSPVMIQCFELD